MNTIDDINFDEHELMMLEASALAIGCYQNEDGSLTSCFCGNLTKEQTVKAIIHWHNVAKQDTPQ